MNLESINKWLDEEYGCSYTKLEELHDFYFEKYTDQKEEINRLNNIINEALGIANERFNYYYHNKNDELLKEWEEIFEELIKRDNELKGDNK